VANIYDAIKRGTVDVKWRVLEFSRFWHSALIFPQNATNCATVLSPWHSALKHTAECQPPLANILRNANSLVEFDRGMPQTDGSTLKYSAERHKPRDRLKPLSFRGTHLSSELGKRLNSSSRHFTSRAPLFEASYLVAAWLLEYKLPTQRIV
jgi:hypothetical protein